MKISLSREASVVFPLLEHPDIPTVITSSFPFPFPFSFSFPSSFSCNEEDEERGESRVRLEVEVELDEGRGDVEVEEGGCSVSEVGLGYLSPKQRLGDKR